MATRGVKGKDDRQRRKRGYGSNEIRWREGRSQARGYYSGRHGRSRRGRRLRCLAEPKEDKRRKQRGTLFLVRRLQTHRIRVACSGGGLDRRKGTVHGCREQQQRRGYTFGVWGCRGQKRNKARAKCCLVGNRNVSPSLTVLINNRKSIGLSGLHISTIFIQQLLCEKFWFVVVVSSLNYESRLDISTVSIQQSTAYQQIPSITTTNINRLSEKFRILVPFTNQDSISPRFPSTKQ
ncbi:unnamed protein product [Lactuca saligna]|uniref:Uncharacterized protein n=1 Tax=Lactuca saligna TaxID=75948 RepID=A0AA35Z076_LACSI|nr:unnamed protein product [Lactuca saligna]